MNFEGFSVIDFPPIDRDAPWFVYVLCWVGESGDIPFYVGQTKRLFGRLDDYYWAMLSAPTDFRVGHAVRYLKTKGWRVIVKHKSSVDPRGEESQIIDDLRESWKLLNDEPGFNWRNADESEEKKRVQEFIDEHCNNYGPCRPL